LALLAAGCSGSVQVTSDFPPPLVAPLPLKVGLYYAPELTDYVYSEDPQAEADWTLHLGAANVRMFDSVFGALFVAVQRVSAVATAREEYPELDAIVAPTVDTFEFSLPSQSRQDQYAVWIRYNVNVYDRNGQLIVRWPVRAYGESDTSGMDGEESMERATVLAMRDAEAIIALELARQPQVREALLKEYDHESP
jgi:hypothetical protein